MAKRIPQNVKDEVLEILKKLEVINMQHTLLDVVSYETLINRSVKKINKWLKYHNPSTIKNVKKPPLKDQ